MSNQQTGANAWRAAQQLLSEPSVERFFADTNDEAFAERIFTTAISAYRAELVRLKFNDLGTVLDAGCGYGQWSLVLAESNKKVLAVDSSAERIAFLRETTSRSQMLNIDAEAGDLEHLNLPSESVDAVFSYSVVNSTRWKKTLSEFRRVLRPGGRLFFTANSIFWYAYLWHTQHNSCSDYSPRQVASEALVNALGYSSEEYSLEGQVVMDPEDTTCFLGRNGFSNMSWAWECGTFGTLDYFHSINVSGRGVFEVEATKAL